MQPKHVAAIEFAKINVVRRQTTSLLKQKRLRDNIKHLNSHYLFSYFRTLYQLLMLHTVQCYDGITVEVEMVLTFFKAK